MCLCFVQESVNTRQRFGTIIKEKLLQLQEKEVIFNKDEVVHLQDLKEAISKVYRFKLQRKKVHF